MSTEKIIGFGLLFAGLMLIALSAFDVFIVFMGKKEPLSVFQFSGISIDFSKVISQPDLSGVKANLDLPADFDLGALMPQKTTGAAQQELISSDMVNRPMNIFAHVFLMGFLSTIGLKIATIGTYLVRTITVKLKEEPTKS